MLVSVLIASAIAAVALFAGVMDYHSIAGLRWIESLLNASMIPTDMGPVDPMPTSAAKLFASASVLFSGLVFVSVVDVVLAPVFHRILHKFHLDDR
jgi:hypothetical protein